MLTILYILYALLILTALVTVHELGHYTAGRLLGFSVMEFSIGMGPRIVKVEKNGIIYSLKAFPIGGSCRFAGEDEIATGKTDFNAMPKWRRAVALASGALCNILFAVVLAIVLLLCYGSYEADMSKVFISSVTPDGSAAIAGVQNGDQVLAVDGTELENYEELRELLSEAKGGVAVITLEREGRVITLTLTNLYSPEEGRNMMGVITEPGRIPIRYHFFEAVGESFRFVSSMIGEMFNFLKQLVTGNVSSQDVAGPVGIVDLFVTYAPEGFEVVLRIAILLSVNLGFINLLPLPALDGGRLVFIGIEAVFRKRVPEEIEGRIHAVGLMLLMGLIIFITVMDISRCAGGG